MNQPARTPARRPLGPPAAGDTGNGPPAGGGQHGATQAAGGGLGDPGQAHVDVRDQGRERALAARQIALFRRIGEAYLELAELGQNQLDEGQKSGLMGSMPVPPLRPFDPPQEESNDRLLSVADLAKKLGVNERTVRRMRTRGKLPPGIDLGSVIRWDPAVIEAWLLERQEPAR